MTPAAFLDWRTRLGLTQAGAARVLGKTRRQVQHYEAGSQAIPTTVQLAMAALAHGLSPADALTGRTAPAPAG